LPAMRFKFSLSCNADTNQDHNPGAPCIPASSLSLTYEDIL
jgi:hypothetical protein